MKVLLLHQKKLKGSYKDFEGAFDLLLEKSKKERVSVLTLLTALSGKGRILLLIFLSLSFGQIPGISIFFGVIVCYLGLRIALGSKFIWLPQCLLNKKIPSYVLIRSIRQILHLLKFMSKWSSPRYAWASHNNVTRVISGLTISFIGLAFALSPPVPLAGFLAFFAIFSISIGLLNDDGIYMIAGHIFAIVYFVLTFFLWKYCSLSQLIDLIKSI